MFRNVLVQIINITHFSHKICNLGTEYPNRSMDVRTVQSKGCNLPQVKQSSGTLQPKTLYVAKNKTKFSLFGAICVLRPIFFSNNVQLLQVDTAMWTVEWSTNSNLPSPNQLAVHSASAQSASTNN
jgi:hypothetical protein